MEKKSFLETKKFAVIALLFGVFGLLIMMHHVGSYNVILNPPDKPWVMEYLKENQILTNDVSGATFLRMFTNISNILVDLYLIFYAVGIFGNRAIYAFTHNVPLRGGITLNILITGVIYCCVLLPAGGGKFPTEIPDPDGVMQSTGAMWFTSVVNFWNHVITPVFFTALWFIQVANKKIDCRRYALDSLIFPVAYFIVCIVLGKDDGFYPYPFLSATQLFSMIFNDKPYNQVVGVLLLIAVVIALSGIFYGFGYLLYFCYNKKSAKTEAKKTKKELA